MFNTPILFLVFNRPDSTKQVFDQIKKIQPKYLFVAADGARVGNIEEKEKCRQTREIILSGIDWNCEVKTLFRDKNLGCGVAVSDAITWFFEQVEEGIILEDDCLPDLTFFDYCETLLEKYRFNNSIFMISGNNFWLGKYSIKTSYSFSRYCNIWGWATWKRSWQLFDYHMANWPLESKSGILENILDKENEILYWKEIFDKVVEGKIDTWDYQLLYSSWKHELLCIEPSVNLVMNIGFGQGATHLTEAAETLKFGYQKNNPMEITDHPDRISNNEVGDRITFYNRYLDPIIHPYKRKNLIGRGKDFIFRITH